VVDHVQFSKTLCFAELISASKLMQDYCQGEAKVLGKI
jgi:hypothetical protein